jgi:hypothetical protein
MPHYTHLSIRDFSDELSGFTVHNGAITVGSIAGYLGQVGTLRSATDAIVLGVIAKEKLTMDDTVISTDLPDNVFAQRELKALITYVGNTSGKTFQIEIPTFDPTGRLLGNSDMIDLTEAAMAAWVSAFTAIGRSPDSDAETVTVISGQLVGRNL